MVVWMPSTTNSSSARRSRIMHSCRRAAVDDQLADQAVVVGRDRVALIDAGIDAHAEAAGRVEVGDPAGRGGEGPRVLGVDAALDGVALEATSSCVNERPRPAATRICSRTRSMPVTASVTGCSTCRRVFISMK